MAWLGSLKCSHLPGLRVQISISLSTASLPAGSRMFDRLALQKGGGGRCPQTKGVELENWRSPPHINCIGFEG